MAVILECQLEKNVKKIILTKFLFNSETTK